MNHLASGIPRRQDTTIGPPLRILSLDGGGIRGYSMLIILQELMHRTYVEIHGEAPRRHQIPKPCDHFDLIAGTGTGGLIAIMLGRLRMDLETCKDVYVRMTRRVFETDKTFAGIPYRSTLFKASKLEEAIKECVREHTVFDDEGNDALANATPMTPETPGSGVVTPDLHRSMSGASRASSYTPIPRSNLGPGRWGNPNALLYDTRENRTKTAVAAVYKGTPKNGSSALLRSYDSRGEPPPEFNCTIWQAGRATSATGLAFKPIQIGQSVFIDEGSGKYNPSPQILDEAAVHEWPGRDVGVFISIGTGKRPGGTDHLQAQWWESFVSTNVGDFAEAKRRLIAKIEGCEETHQYMLREHLQKRGVNPENYYRLNVEVGVGEFGMNEWNRLSDISTNTRMYLKKEEVQKINLNAAVKMSRIHRAKARFDRVGMKFDDRPPSWDQTPPNEPMPPSKPTAVELPGDVQYYQGSHVSSQRPTSQPHYYQQTSAPDDKFAVVSPDPYSQTTGSPHRQPAYPARPSYEQRYNGGHDVSPPRQNSGAPNRTSPPPLPPKTPIGQYARPVGQQQPPIPQPHGTLSRPPAAPVLPYPDNDAPPPPVNMARKPEFGPR